MDYIFFMKEAIKEANKALELGEVPVGAIIVLDDEIIGRGHNCVEYSKQAFRHAEIVAIEEASNVVGDWRLEDAVIFSTLEPCIMCAGAIVHSRIKTLVYGAIDEQRGFAGSVLNIVDDGMFNHRVEVVAGVLKKECSEIINEFFKQRRKDK